MSIADRNCITHSPSKVWNRGKGRLPPVARSPHPCATPDLQRFDENCTASDPSNGRTLPTLQFNGQGHGDPQALQSSLFKPYSTIEHRTEGNPTAVDSISPATGSCTEIAGSRHAPSCNVVPVIEPSHARERCRQSTPSCCSEQSTASYDRDDTICTSHRYHPL